MTKPLNVIRVGLFYRRHILPPRLDCDFFDAVALALAAACVGAESVAALLKPGAGGINEARTLRNQNSRPIIEGGAKARGATQLSFLH
jgi:hypothetical protein